MTPSKFSFSIRTILIATGYTAIAAAALVNPNKMWVGVNYGITVGLLFFSLLGAFYRTERARAFWTGFALFGFGYLAIVFGPLSNLSEKLPTTLVLNYARANFHEPTHYSPYGISSFPMPTYYPPSTTTYIPPPVTTYSSPSQGTYVPGPDNSTTPVTTSSTDDIPPDGEEQEEATTETDRYTPDASTTGPLATIIHSTPSYSTPVTSYPIYPSTPVTVDPYTFMEIGQAVFAMAFAALGGLMAWVLFAVRPERQTQSK